jgi:hypothetical protein
VFLHYQYKRTQKACVQLLYCVYILKKNHTWFSRLMQWKYYLKTEMNYESYNLIVHHAIRYFRIANLYSCSQMRRYNYYYLHLFTTVSIIRREQRPSSWYTFKSKYLNKPYDQLGV